MTVHWQNGDLEFEGSKLSHRDLNCSLKGPLLLSLSQTGAYTSNTSFLQQCVVGEGKGYVYFLDLGISTPKPVLAWCGYLHNVD